MLQIWMETRMFYYCMIAVGILGIFTMLLLNDSNDDRMDKMHYVVMNRRLKKVTLTVSIISIALSLINILSTILLKDSMVFIYWSVILCVGIIASMLLIRKILFALSQERMMYRYMIKNIEKVEKTDKMDLDVAIPSQRESKKTTKNTKFSKYLTPEEEGIMREVIKEYMT